MWQRFLHLFPAGADRIIRRGNAVALHEFLGEALARFQLRGCACRPKDRPSPPLEFIHHAQGQRQFRSHHGKIRAEPGGQLHHASRGSSGRPQRTRHPPRYRHCPGRSTASSLAAIAAASRRSRVRDRHCRGRGLSWGIPHRCSANRIGPRAKEKSRVAGLTMSNHRLGNSSQAKTAAANADGRRLAVPFRQSTSFKPCKFWLTKVNYWQ